MCVCLFVWLCVCVVVEVVAVVVVVVVVVVFVCVMMGVVCVGVRVAVRCSWCCTCGWYSSCCCSHCSRRYCWLSVHQARACCAFAEGVLCVPHWRLCTC